MYLGIYTENPTFLRIIDPALEGPNRRATGHDGNTAFPHRPARCESRRGRSGLNTIPIEVEWDADDSERATPRRLLLGKRVIEAAEILDCWPGADHRYIKLRGDDGRLYIVRHDVPGGRWEMTLYDRRGPGQ
jgi:hypothetical protein